MKAIQYEELEPKFPPLRGRTLAKIIEKVGDRRLGNLDAAAALCNDIYCRDLLSKLGSVELRVLRTRRCLPGAILKICA